ncbi:hypothetical protein, partial [Frankia canadensis]|uniref:hypothetical protein n=1 Tax=Frankia canadensis TaxID=1836972 RepID=UPI001A9C67A4
MPRRCQKAAAARRDNPHEDHNSRRGLATAATALASTALASTALASATAALAASSCRAAACLAALGLAEDARQDLLAEVLERVGRGLALG